MTYKIKLNLNYIKNTNIIYSLNMNTDIEEFIKNKNSMGSSEYNNIDIEKYDHKKFKIIFDDLLSLIHKNKNLTNIADNFELVKQTLQDSLDYGWTKTKTVEQLRKVARMTVRQARECVKNELGEQRRWEDGIPEEEKE